MSKAGTQMEVPGTPEPVSRVGQLSQELNEAVADVYKLERDLRGARARERLLRRELAAQYK